MSSSSTILSTENLTIGYSSKRGAKKVLEHLNLHLRAGQLTCLLGPNGSGKSTLMRTLAGIQKPLGGSVALEGRALNEITSKELATKLSLVLTDRTTPGNLTAYAVVSLGRFPYTSWLGSLSEEDKEKIHWAMHATGADQFANTHVGELSDGERQKVMIARSLAQDTSIIFLDEPTAHLDLPNRIEIFHLLRELAIKSGKAILLSSHEMDMALTSADRLWLVTPDNTIASGVPEDLVLNRSLEKSFAREHLRFDYKSGGFKRREEHQGSKIFIEGPEMLVKWTKNALERYGYTISNKEIAAQVISVSGGLDNVEWQIGGEKTTYKTIEQLLKAIQK